MQSSSGQAFIPPIKFIQEQLDIIDSDVGVRQYVEAGPGTGKTAVACARIAKLIRDGINPSTILIISFTRTAVRELRDRIRSWSESGIGALNIYTIDQTAFRFVRAENEVKDLMASGYEVTVEKAVAELRSGSGSVFDYVRSLRHVLIDEAQDITDVRADFVSLLITSLSPAAGATILADPCQAIFGFTQDNEDGDGRPPRLFLKDFPFGKLGFVDRKLTVLHRTDSKELCDLFIAARKRLGAKSGEIALRGVVGEIESKRDLGTKIEDFQLGHGHFIIFRKRVQAVQAANFYPGLHRLRLPGYPPAIYPWVALCFSDSKSPAVPKAAFLATWQDRVSAALADGWTAERAFDTLLGLARVRDNVDLRLLRIRLAIPQPPPELCYPDFGATGPVFSTIHAVKGREADRVVLMLPRKLDNAVEYSASHGESAVHEEARVYYVGATRVRREFARGTANTLVGARKLDDGSDREVMVAFKMGKTSKFQFGRNGDIAEERAISVRHAWCDDDSTARERQRDLVGLWLEATGTSKPTYVTGESIRLHVGGKEEYHYKFTLGTKFVAWSGTGLETDLWAVARQAKTKYGGRGISPGRLPYLRFLGLRTVSVSDDVQRSELCAPYCDSGFFLAPMIAGFAHVYL